MKILNLITITSLLTLAVSPLALNAATLIDGGSIASGGDPTVTGTEVSD